MNTNLFVMKTLTVVALLFTVSSLALCQGDRTNMMDIGMARSLVSDSRGLEAVGTNPANLVLPHIGGGVEYFRMKIRRSTLDTTNGTSSSIPESLAVKYDSAGGNGRLIGRVVDDASGDPVIGAAVSVPGTPYQTLTAADGRYELDNLPAGIYSLKISNTGYHDVWLTGVGIRARLQTKENVRMAVANGLRDESSMAEYTLSDSYTAVRETPPDVTFSLFPVGFSFGSDLLNYNVYQNYFTGVDTNGTTIAKFLSDADKNNILSVFPNGVAHTHTYFDVRLLGFTFHSDEVGDIALTVTDHMAIDFNLSADYMRFGFFGLDSLGSTYNFSGTAVNGWYIRDYALSFARKIPQIKFMDDFAAGITIKRVEGYAAIITNHYNASFGNTPLPGGGYSLNGNFDFELLRSNTDIISGNQSNFTPVPAPAGQGLGADVGFSGELFRGFRAGMSLTDIGSINWTANARERVINTSLSTTNPTLLSQYNAISQAFNGKEVAISSFSTPLPTALRIGGSTEVDNLPFIGFFPGDMLLAFQYEQGFNDSPGNTTVPRFSAGAEWRLIPFLPIRTGISAGGEDHFNWAAGFGLDMKILTLNVGTENIGVLFSPNSFHLLSLGAEIIVRI
jgi:hypothetical protein